MGPGRVFIRQLNHGFPRVDGWGLRRTVKAIQGLAGVSQYDLMVACVGSRYIRRLNRQYRNVDEETDVLSFPGLEVRAFGVKSSVFWHHRTRKNSKDVLNQLICLG